MVRVHAISIKKLPSNSVEAPSLSQQLLPQHRQAAVRLLADALGGDVLAAEYLLLQSLERVTARTAEAAPMGIFPLGITNCPAPAAASPAMEAIPEEGGAAPAAAAGDAPDFARCLHMTLASLLPLTAYLPLNIQECNQVGRSSRAFLLRRFATNGPSDGFR